MKKREAHFEKYVECCPRIGNEILHDINVCHKEFSLMFVEGTRYGETHLLMSRSQTELPHFVQRRRID